MKDKLTPHAIASNIANFDDYGYIELHNWRIISKPYDDTKLNKVVKAYNMHDELLELLKDMRILTHSWKRQNPQTIGYKFAQRIEELIKKAEQ